MLPAQPLQKTHRTKEEYVYDALHDAIMRCELAPGEKLVIDTISDWLEVSPIPVRGALQRLQAEGLVEITPHTGAVVSEISPDNISEIFVLLESLESIAFNDAAQKATATDLAYLRQLIDGMAQAIKAGDAGRWYDLNNQFHLAVAGITQMKMLIRFTARALASRDRLRHFYSTTFVTSRMSEAHAEHCQMVDLLESLDLDHLTPLVAKHNRTARQAYQKLIENKLTD